jgi:hypothetical protein
VKNLMKILLLILFLNSIALMGYNEVIRKALLTGKIVGDEDAFINVDSLAATHLVTDGNFVTTGTIDLTITNNTAGGEKGINLNIAEDTINLTGTLDAIYARATGFGADNSHGRVQGCEIGARLPHGDGTKAVGEVVAGYFWADTKIGDVGILRGVEVSLDGGAGGTATSAVAFEAFNNTSAAYTTSIAYDVNEGACVIRAPYTYDMRMQNGETMDNATDGTINFTSNVIKQMYDAAAYYTITQADAGGVTFNSVSDGTAGFDFSDPATITLAVTAAGGTSGLYSYVNHTTNALTGDLIGVKGNARCDVASTSGKVIGGYFLAGNFANGYNLEVARGVYAGVVNKVPTASSATWTDARGVEVIMDLNQGESGHVNAITNACMFYGVYNLPTSGAYSTVTNGYGIYVKNEAVGGTGQALDAAFYVCDASMSGGIKGWDYGVDLSGVAAGFTVSDLKLSSGAKIFTGSQTTEDGVYGEVGAYDATGSIYLSTGGELFIQVANNGAAADWETVTNSSVD